MIKLKNIIIFIMMIKMTGICNTLNDSTSEKSPNLSKINETQAYAFYIENDSRRIGGPGSDQAYTNGFKFSYLYAEEKVPVWASKFANPVSLLDYKNKFPRLNYGFSISHQMYTPSDTGATELITEDRPYAGWLNLGFAVSIKELSVEQFIEINLGIVGPSALGEQVQNSFHKLIKSSKSEGWKNQLKNEPTLQLFYQKRIKLISSSTLSIIPFAGASLGNVYIGTHIGGVIRYGLNLPDNFGSSRPSASDGNSFISATQKLYGTKSSYYIFSGIRGDIHIKNIFLDGNNFQPSHFVKKYPLTFESEFGFGMQFEVTSFVWSFVTKSPEFEQKKLFSSFASLNFVYFP